ncbi:MULTISPECIES: GNAT family N-acetyltransferase [Paenibacillus]|uniref:GNAT family N-acetyltransferase n=1 Tax=Paenibacillus TaxID=44249 RepID=UPI0022B8AE4B|nr:GNAT family N-acetyltransferase [Paenibacillus caseinilyticus]MCZ8523476.1 GNAT family N-acetyltransferase [Paenibacillus caseinilyticus]
MIRKIDLDHMREVLPLLELQQTAYRLEAELMGMQEVPPLLDSPATLKDSEECFFGYYEGERLVGAGACKQSRKELLICRMMVHPDCFRQGIASRLLQHMETFAPPGMRIRVATGTKNEPAVRLYEKHGYVPGQVHLVAPGVSLTQFQKRG